MNYEATAVTPNLTQIRMDVIPDCLTNCFVYRAPTTNYVIDTGFGSETAAAVRPLLDPSKKTLIVNTHSHWDHVWGNGSFPEDILAHSACPDRISSLWTKLRERNAACLRGDSPMRLPTLLFDREHVLPLDGIECFWATGHTTDGINLWIPAEGLLIAGDNIGDNANSPVPELESTREEYAKSVERYAALKPKIIVSGHNTPVGQEFLTTILRSLTA